MSAWTKTLNQTINKYLANKAAAPPPVSFAQLNQVPLQQPNHPVNVIWQHAQQQIHHAKSGVPQWASTVAVTGRHYTYTNDIICRVYLDESVDDLTLPECWEDLRNAIESHQQLGQIEANDQTRGYIGPGWMSMLVATATKPNQYRTKQFSGPYMDISDNAMYGQSQPRNHVLSVLATRITKDNYVTIMEDHKLANDQIEFRGASE